MVESPSSSKTTIDVVTASSTVSSPSSTTTNAHDKLEQKFIRLCESYEQGLPDSVLKERLAKVPVEARAHVINSLLGKGRLLLLQSDTEIIYRIVSEEDARRFRGLDHEGVLIYRLIEQSHDKGIWIRDLRMKSNLEQSRITKIIKILMQKKLVKELKSVSNKRKVYLKFDVQPCKDIIGGALSNGADLDAVFVSALRTSCLQFIRKHEKASTNDLEEFVRSVKISNVRLEMEDMQQVINSLLYDCAIEKVPESASAGRSFAGKRKRVDTQYRLARFTVDKSSYGAIPCCMCPVANECNEHSDISPSSCEYLQAWLDF